ncbi:Coatomer, alpha subunit [Coemansia reversa NRRL 1564]|uniref:Coatomer subunit alpha n=1 Tax=Coemansia reversa (strain ATCC 12441 / NRRL 1564) TaxID=763665 RepID=A0A2G5BHF9_COERN|nr:Coatomer, alpha subunit [Coemansia reversa NRRL 1564]|eukprot:PIA18421.1 Coatomer, alpha subunit [Coemansia reversa NRRL 1564]
MQMLTKFETKSSRVKGVAFHPKRPWVLASLHNGSVQLWDYRMGTLLDRFEEHEGPVRGISFHPTQDIFVSGGDDYKVKVWDCRTRRCMFTLQGHLDYVRTVYFHLEQPWIISASDDQTIRIWNWQSRQCIAVLTGHNHYVMCAQFHPTDDLVVSACLDQTVRVWDISGLRRKNAAGAQQSLSDSMSSQRMGSQSDFFNVTDVVVKFVLEGHTRGVNWATFHPTMPLILSCGDDRQVKIWRMNDSRAWEVDTCRGHYNNVNSAIFHPKREFILSDSEDKTIRVWDTTRRTLLQTFRRDQDRFWCLNAHPELNLFAAGHDNGLIVFKLERERPAAAIHQNTLLYVKEAQIRLHDFTSANDAPMIPIRTAPAGQYLPPPRAISFNPSEKAVLLTSDVEGGSYELYSLPQQFSGQVSEAGQARRGTGSCAIWTGRNRFAVLDKAAQQVLIKDLSNQTTKTIKLQMAVEAIFNAPGSQILLATATSVVLFDLQTRQAVAEINAPAVKYVAWSADMSSVALLCKHSITLANKQLEQHCQVHETIRIKSAAWDESGVLVYTTLNHIKFALPKGDSGIIRTIDNPVYVVRVQGGNVHCLDRGGTVNVIKIDPTEYRFKLALQNRNYEEVVSIIRNSNLVGQSIIAYLQKNGYPEIALHFVRDDTARFELALECGNMDIALETAKAIDKPAYWEKFSQEALRRGHIHMVELAYQRTKAYDKLSFLYSITGNIEKLAKMQKISIMRNDLKSRLQDSLFLGDVEDRVRVLREAGQHSLAYLTAKTHGLESEAESIRVAAGVEEADIVNSAPAETPVLLRPSIAIIRSPELDWPQLNVSKGVFDGNFSLGDKNAGPRPGKSRVADLASAGVDGDDTGGAWDIDDGENMDTDEANVFGDTLAAGHAEQPDVLGEEPGAEGGWGIDDDGDLDAEIAAEAAAAAAAGFVAPQPGISELEAWSRNSPLAVDQIAAGNFEQAMELLRDQAGIASFDALKPAFLEIYSASRSVLTTAPFASPSRIPLRRNPGDTAESAQHLPAQIYNLPASLEQLQHGYRATTSARFEEGLTLFKRLLLSLIFVSVDTVEDANEVKQLLQICREYIVGISIELERATVAKEDPTEANATRLVELAAYFTHCKLRADHEKLALRLAMNTAYKHKCFKAAGEFAQRLVDLVPAPQIAEKARKMITICDRQSRDTLAINYDARNPFVICAASHAPIHRGEAAVNCPYCQATYKPEYKGQLCRVCTIAQIGAKATGIRSLASSD